MDRRTAIWLGVFGGVLALAVLVRLLVGPAGFGWPSDGTVLGLRGTRVLTGVIVGGSLGAAGVMLQALLRNPLASPDLVGVSAGAGFGVMVSFALGAAAGQGAVPLLGLGGPALVGGAGALLVVFALSQRRGLVDPVSMILVGVIISIVLGSASMLLRQALPDRGLLAARWLLGDLSDDVSWMQLVWGGVICVVGVGVGAWLGRAMDAASMGEDEARSVGVPLGGLRAMLFLGGGVLTASTVVLAGPIGFVGLVAPHVVRLVMGPSHRALVVGAALAGAALVVGADAAIRLVELPGGRPPIGAITSLIGGPLFILLLRREMGRGA